MLRIVESVRGLWHYHLRDDEQSEHKTKPALCGARVMTTSIPLEQWDSTPDGYHLQEKWCKECFELSKLEKK